jgi:hypothetical protein
MMDRIEKLETLLLVCPPGERRKLLDALALLYMDLSIGSGRTVMEEPCALATCADSQLQSL